MKSSWGKSKSICFVSETGRSDRPLQDPSVRYRGYHPAEMLSAMGHRCTVYSAAKFFEAPSLYDDMYVFHRPNAARPNFRKVVASLRANGSRLVADYDDLIFGGEDIALGSSAVKNETLTADRAIAAFANNLAGLREFDKVTVSTQPLAEQARVFNPDAQVEVVPNIVPDSVLVFQDYLKSRYRQRPRGTIGYFAGTKSHDRDFPEVEAALHRVLMENPDFTLLIVGPVKISSGIAALPNVFTAPVVNYLRLPGLMTMCDTVIAPLEHSLFNDCKSRVKFLEAALAGCRLVASPIPDMTAIGDQHITFAANLGDWYEALSSPPKIEERRSLADRNFAYIRAQRNLHAFLNFGELQ